MIYLSNQNIAQLLTPKDCIEALDEAFHALARGEAASRPRTDVWVPCGRDDGYYRWGSMEGAIEPWGIFCRRMKSDIITWTPQGTDELHCVQPGTFSGFLMLFSTRNGEPLAMMNDGILHHLRVAAGAALGVRYLARENASVVGCLGSGGMAHAYLPAFCAVRKISQVKVYSPTQAHRETFAKEMSRELDISVEPFDDPEPVVRGSDIVTTCTDSNKLVVTDPTWIEKGMHLANCSSREFSLEIVKRCDIVAQVGTETFGAKGGMAESERHHGWASWVVGRPEQQARIPKRPVSNLDFVNYPALTDLLNNPSMRRTSAAQITFFHNLGLLGFQFAAVAAKAYQIARAKGVGLAMSTDPFLQDIRDQVNRKGAEDAEKIDEDTQAWRFLKYGTEDSLMIGTDYSHADQSAEIQALDVIEQRGEKGEIPASVACKILDDNPRTFYMLQGILRKIYRIINSPSLSRWRP